MARIIDGARISREIRAELALEVEGLRRDGIGVGNEPVALAGEDLEEIGAGAIDAAELGADVEEAEIGLRLSRGDHSAHVWFSDLGYDYVKLNAEYTT